MMASLWSPIRIAGAVLLTAFAAGCATRPALPVPESVQRNGATDFLFSRPLPDSLIRRPAAVDISELLQTRIPEIELVNANVLDTMEHIVHCAHRANAAETGPLSFVWDGTGKGKIALRMTNATTAVAITHMGRNAGLVWDVLAGAVFLGSKTNLTRVAAAHHKALRHVETKGGAWDELVPLEYGHCMACFGDIVLMLDRCTDMKMVAAPHVRHRSFSPDWFYANNMKLRDFVSWLCVLSGTEAHSHKGVLEFRTIEPNLDRSDHDRRRR